METAVINEVQDTLAPVQLAPLR